MLFDVIQISWWLIQATLLGLLLNRKIFDNGTDRILFAPITGFACVFILGSMLWMARVPTYLMSYLFVGTLVFALVSIIKERFKPAPGPTLWLAAGAMLVILHGSLIPFSEKLFQAFPMDRDFYLGASILFQKENLTYFQDAIARLSTSGDKRVWISHPLMPLAISEMMNRPAVEIGFLIFSWATPRDLYRLANAWEVFFRVLQFSGLLALFWKGLGPRFLSGFLALATVFGYWFQYTKNYNAWSSSACLALAIAIIAYVILILNNGKVENRNKYFTYFLIVTAVTTYPELGIPFTLGLLLLVCTNKILRNGILLKKTIVLDLAGLTAAIFLVHPYILAFIKRQSGLAPIMIGGEEPMARGFYRLLATLGDRYQFVATVIEKPIRLLFDPVSLADMITGSAGLPYITYLKSPITLFIVLLIVGSLAWSWMATKKPHLFARPYFKVWLSLGLFVLYTALFFVIKKHVKDYDFGLPISFITGALILGLVIWSVRKTSRPNLRILLILVAFYEAFFIGMLILNMVGGSYRTPPFWGGFGSACLLILLAASEVKILQRLAVLAACAHLAFGISIFYVTNKKGMEKYPEFFPASSGVRHFEAENVRDKYDFDYTDILPQLKSCQTVYLALPQNVDKELRLPRFQAVNLMMFLENYDISYYLSMPYRNASPLIGGEYFPGFTREEVNADCVVEDEVRNGRISFKFVQAKWH